MASEDLKAVILAAGKGVRLSQLTRRRPKVMLKFLGKPLLEHTLISLRKAGIKDIIIVIGYKGDKIIEYFLNGSNIGVNITYVTDRMISGTATAIKAAENYVNSTFLMVFGDVFPEPILLNSLIKRHFEAKKHAGSNIVATLSLTKVDDPFNHAPVFFKGEVVEEFWSKKSSWVDMGVMVLEPIVFDKIKQTPRVRGEYRILETLNLLMKEGYKVIAYPSNYPWVQIGDHRGLQSIIEANNYFLDKAGLENCIIESEVSDSKLYKTSIIRAQVFNSELSNCLAYENSVIVSSKLMNCIIDEEVKVIGKKAYGVIFTSSYLSQNL